MDTEAPDRTTDLPAEAERLETALAGLREACEQGDRERADAGHRKALETVTRMLQNPELRGHPELADAFAEQLDRVEDEARRLFSDTLVDSAALGLQLSGLRTSIRQLRRIIRVVAGHSVRDEVPFLLAELRDAENGMAHGRPEVDEDDEEEDDDGSATDAAEQDLTESRVEVLRSHVDRLLSQVEDARFDTLDDARVAFELARGLDVTRFRLAEDAAELGDAVAEPLKVLGEKVDRERIDLLDRAYAFLESQPPADRLRVLVEVGPSVAQEIDEARVSSTEKADPQDIARLERLEQKARRFGQHLDDARRKLRNGDVDSELAGDARGVRRRLFRQTRVAHRVRTDQVLALRLAGVFGPRMVRLWEGLVFWLILAVLGLLIVDHYREPDPHGVIGWTVWVDTVICGLLLLDFATRVALHQNRTSYFFRHALTDLLPSLPFGLLSNLDAFTDLRATRMLRLVRVFRVLRVLRPILRFLRLFLFLSRAMDRIVERNAWFLNRNLVFLTEGEVEDRESPVLKRVRDLELWIFRTTSRTFARLPPSAQARAATWRASWVRHEVELCPPSLAPRTDASGLRQIGGRNIEVDDAVRFLRDLDDGQVAELIGPQAARDIDSSLRFFRLPVVRGLRPVRYVMGPRGAPDPLKTTARLGNLLGDQLARTQRLLQWFADLHGTITGAQFLDRLGLQLVQATQRPTKRLIMIAVAGAVLYAAVKALRMTFLSSFAETLLGLLLGPIAIIGGVCLVLLLLGTWFRKIAGKVADLYDRVSDGQFLSLTETAKEDSEAEHLAVLAERVLGPDARVARGAEDPGACPEEETGDLDRALTRRLRERHSGVVTPVEGEAETEADARQADQTFDELGDRLLLFYREFLDGSPLHPSDTKVASMLLGNLTLENIRINRLGWTPKQIARLQAIDLHAGRGGITGPGIWFRFITRAVSHHAARLILEYNQHCIRLDELEVAAQEDKDLFEDWLKRRADLSEVRRRGGSLPPRVPDNDGTSGTLTYRTTEFHALHFLTSDPELQATVTERYGPRVAELVREDRRQLIRDIFGTFPAQGLDDQRRIFNPYTFYTRFCSHGRFVLLPFVFLFFGLIALKMLVKQVVKIVKDVIRPHERPLKACEGHAGFPVARRKIHRMRRPVVMEAVRLRANFDPEYLGLALPGRPLSIRRGVATDLRELNAAQREWEEFRDLKSRIEPRVVLLARLLQDECERRGASGATLEEQLVQLRPRIADHPGSSLRAMTLAFACDHQGLHGLADADHLLRQFLEHLPAQPDRLGFPPLLPRRIVRLAARHWPCIAGEQHSDRSLWKRFRNELVEQGRSMLPVLETLDRLRKDIPDVRRHVVDRLLDIAEQPSAWTEQLQALRTVQTLAILDLEGYERIVADLGEYPEQQRHERRGSEGRSDL